MKYWDTWIHVRVDMNYSHTQKFSFARKRAINDSLAAANYPLISGVSPVTRIDNLSRISRMTQGANEWHLEGHVDHATKTENNMVISIVECVKSN